MTETPTPTLLDAALQIAAQAHAGQRRKYTGEPYLSHCIEVVNILIKHGVQDDSDVLMAAAALHDVLEDCAGWATYDRIILCQQLCDRAKYHADNWANVAIVWRLVGELTEPAHEGNRATRKALEAQRLSQISPEAQTIKYADLISNTTSIVQHDTGFAKVYLQEKWNILGVMTAGDQGLLREARFVCCRAADEIGLVLT